jgi:predicted transcriptional regulator
MRTWTLPPVRISGSLKSRVNQLAHRMAAKYEIEQREALTERLKGLAAKGKRLPELHAVLDDLERE